MSTQLLVSEMFSISCKINSDKWLEAVKTLIILDLISDKKEIKDVWYFFYDLEANISRHVIEELVNNLIKLDLV